MQNVPSAELLHIYSKVHSETKQMQEPYVLLYKFSERSSRTKNTTEPVCVLHWRWNVFTIKQQIWKCLKILCSNLLGQTM